MPVSEVLIAAGITLEEQALARCKRATGALWHLYQNHRSASAILGVLGLRDAEAEFSVRYKGGLTLTTAEVVSELGWCARTFVRKSQGFHRVQDIVGHYTWHAGLPPVNPVSKAQEALQKHYNTWDGLVAMFGEGGF